MIFKKSKFSLAVALLLVASSDAKAEEGIGSDTFRVVPSVGLSSEYRSNLYLEEGEIGGGEPVNSGTALLVNPVMKFVVSGQNVRSSVGISYMARKYLDAELANLDRYKDAQIISGLQLFPQRIIGFSIDDRFTSSGRENAADDAETAYIQRITNDLRSGLVISPGPASNFKFGGIFGVEDITGADVRNNNDPRSHNNKLIYGGYADATWKFLPKTSLYIESEYTQFDWWKNVINTTPDNVCTDADLTTCFIGIPNGTTVRSVFGLTGQFTDKLLLRLGAGYGTADYDEDSIGADSSINETVAEALRQGAASDTTGADGLLVSATIGLMPTSNQQFKLDFERSFADVYFSNYSVYNQVLFTHSWMILQRAEIKSAARYRMDQYQGNIVRTDHRVTVQSDVSLKLANQTSLDFGSSWRRMLSPNNPSLEYDDVSIHGGLLLKY